MGDKINKRKKRRKRIRAKAFGYQDKPRLSVYRSNKYIYAQLINDEKGITLVSASEKDVKAGVKSGKSSVKGKQVQKKGSKAFAVGEELAKKALKRKIKNVVFDRSGYKYHGRVKQLAEGARKGGLNL